MPAIIVNLAALVSLLSFGAIPTVLIYRSVRYQGPLPAKLIASFVSLLFWLGLSFVHAGVWFFVAYASHKVDPLFTATWTVSNLAYPMLGLAVVFLHRRALMRRKYSIGDSG